MMAGHEHLVLQFLYLREKSSSSAHRLLSQLKALQYSVVLASEQWPEVKGAPVSSRRGEDRLTAREAVFRKKKPRAVWAAP